MFEPACVYHIYNRANGNENLFREKKNYDFFLDKYFKYIDPVAETYAYCLLRNHFHMMVRVKSEEEIYSNLGSETSQKFKTFGKLVSRQFGSLFSAYTQAFNKVYHRRGKSFSTQYEEKTSYQRRLFYPTDPVYP